MKFTSKKDVLFQSITFILIAFFVGIILFKNYKNGFENINFYWEDILLLLVIIFLLGSYFATNYELTKTHFKYRSGIINGKIEIDKINEIIKGKTMWSGLKPATARNGLIIKYEKFNEIYISPKTNDTFINEILKLNNNIKITEEK